MSLPVVLVADLGRANIASLMAALTRAGAEPRLCRDPRQLAAAPIAALPGVGAFGEVASRLEASGIGAAFKERIAKGLPSLGICLGMQLFFDSSDESPGARGIGALPGRVRRFSGSLPLPQFGWNRVSGGGSLLAGLGWAYYANSYKLDAPPAGWTAAWSDYGQPFVAAIERGSSLLCQFHPELSGEPGLALLSRWLVVAKSAVVAKGDEAAGNGACGGVAVAAGSPGTGRSAVRIIPCLDVDKGRVVKGTRFLDLKDMGDPAELAWRYEREGADELTFLDISAGLQGRDTAVHTIRAVRASCGLPMCAGGGVRSLADAEALLSAGADKIAINSRAYRDTGLVRGIAREFGSQACVVAVDASRGADGVPRVVLDAGKTVLDEDAPSWIRRAVELGAGEILLTSRDRDGTGQGYDLELLRSALAAAGSVPIVASGGVASAEHIVEGVAAGASAALLAGALHRGELSISDIKLALRRAGAEVRI
jgi:imidazole glycerol phosphate synthase glutamine amidotransferase subunit